MTNEEKRALRAEAVQALEDAGLREHGQDLRRCIVVAFSATSIAPGVFEAVQRARLALCRLYVAEHEET